MSTGSILPSPFSKLVVFLYALAFVWWIGMLLTDSRDTIANNSYGLILGLIPVLGGLGGISLSRQWGMFSSAVGKTLFFLGLGLVSWGIGTLIFSGYYNLLSDVEVPYPSLADVGYVLAIPLWIVGMTYLSKATGAKFGSRSSGGKSILLLVPIIIIALSYYLLIIVARGGWFDFSDSPIPVMVFDLLYPSGDVVILTVATLVYGLSYKYFGGQYKRAIYLLLAGFVVMYLADFSFSYTTTLETFYVGDWVDFLFTTAVFLLSYAVVLFDRRALTTQGSSNI